MLTSSEERQVTMEHHKKVLLHEKDGEWLIEQMNDDLKLMSFDEYYANIFLTGKIGWNHPTFAKLRQREQEQDDYIKTPYQVEEGVIPCIRCGCYRVFSSAVQTRAADEPLSIVAHCVSCGKRWTQNG